MTRRIFGFRSDSWAALLITCGCGMLHAGTLPPEFAVATAAGDFRIYSPSSLTRISSSQYSVSDSAIRATVTSLGPDQWQLSINPIVKLTQEYFPWQSDRLSLGDAVTNEYYFFPILMGVVENASVHNTDWQWYGGPFPGYITAPLIILANDSNAKIIAALNWPPKALTPQYGGQRMILRYDESVSPGSTATYSALQADAAATPSLGIKPWMAAIDRYKSWWGNFVPDPQYPSWMYRGDGFMDIQLNGWGNDFGFINSVWQSMKSKFPLILFWGQMSPPGGECCALSQSIYPTYNPSLINFADSVASSGYHVGYYATPYYGDPNRLLATPAGQQWFTSWVDYNSSHGANAYYLDQIARNPEGDPAVIEDLFADGTIPNNAVVEGFVDIYPTASLISGALVSDATYCGAPHKNYKSVSRTTFPGLLRYLADHRLMYEGESNTDWRFWGNTQNWTETNDKDGINSACDYVSYCASNGPCQYGTERLGFLLGTKFDVMQPANPLYPGGGSAYNPILDAIINERDRVNWWNRNPQYQDTRGLDTSTIPASSAIEVRKFKTDDGKFLIAISNPKVIDGVTFRILDSADGPYTISVPAQAIAIVESR